TVEAGLGMADRALEGRQRLSEIGEDAVDAVAARFRQAGPRRLLSGGSERRRVGRQMRQVRQRAEQRLILLPVGSRYETGEGGAVAGLLARVLHRAERLRPEAVLAPVPEEPPAVPDACKRHGPAICGARRQRQRPVVLELPLLHVAGGA